MFIDTGVLTIRDAIYLFWASLGFLFGRHFLLVVLLVCFGKGANDCVMATEHDVTKTINTRPRPSSRHSSPQRLRKYLKVLQNHCGIILKVMLNCCEFIMFLAVICFTKPITQAIEFAYVVLPLHGSDVRLLTLAKYRTIETFTVECLISTSISLLGDEVTACYRKST